MTLALVILGGYMATMLVIGCWNELRGPRTIHGRPAKPQVRYHVVKRIKRGFEVVR